MIYPALDRQQPWCPCATPCDVAAAAATAPRVWHGGAVQWSLAIDVFNHLCDNNIECDAVTCCSLITALDKGGQWQLAEQVRGLGLGGL